MCGQMSGDLSYLVLLLGLGLSEFSASPKVLPELKRAVRLIRIEDARDVANEVLREADIERTIEILTQRKIELIGGS
jgi:phosphotransferase system enzyme I (PtsI)